MLVVVHILLGLKMMSSCEAEVGWSILIKWGSCKIQEIKHHQADAEENLVLDSFLIHFRFSCLKGNFEYTNSLLREMLFHMFLISLVSSFIHVLCTTNGRTHFYAQFRFSFVLFSSDILLLFNFPFDCTARSNPINTQCKCFIDGNNL